MNHWERRLLITAPITITVHGRTYPTAGCHVRKVWPESGARVSTVLLEDEELLFGRDRQ